MMTSGWAAASKQTTIALDAEAAGAVSLAVVDENLPTRLTHRERVALVTVERDGRQQNIDKRPTVANDLSK